MQGSATDERYTPRWVFEGMNTTFDLDPCSPGPGLCPAADWCHTSWTAEDDGLNRPWIGLVWCNPPYSKPGPWARKMIDHGHGVMLMPFSSSAAWVQELLAAIDLLWIPKTVRFDHPLESATTISFAVFFAGLGRGTTAVATLASSGRMPGALWHPAQTIS